MAVGYHAKVGPVYRHFVEIRFRVMTSHGLKIIESCCDFLRKDHPRPWKGRVLLRLNLSDVRRLGLRGTRLTLRLVKGRLSASYRTAHLKTARAELIKLFNPRSMAAATVELKPVGVEYVEFFAAVPAQQADFLRHYLPSPGATVDASLERKRIDTLYGQRLEIPIGVKGSIRVALVMYQPKLTKTPHHVKLEIKVPAERQKKLMVLGEAVRNRFVGVLRECLRRAGVAAERKPAEWIGRPLRITHTFGYLQKLIHQRLQLAPEKAMHIAELARALKRNSPDARRNIRESLRAMEASGDVNLTRRNGRISSVRLFDYAVIFTPSAAALTRARAAMLGPRRARKWLAFTW